MKEEKVKDGVWKKYRQGKEEVEERGWEIRKKKKEETGLEDERGTNSGKQEEEREKSEECE